MEALLTVALPGRESQLRRVPPQPFTVGRGMRWGIEDRDGWCSRMLVELDPTEHGWICRNFRAGLHVEGTGILEATCHEGAAVLLTTGDWTLHWDHRLTLAIAVRRRLSPDQARIPLATQAGDIDELMTTAPEALQLSATDLHRLALLFRHLLESTEAPVNLARAAGPALGMGEAVARDYANKQRRKVQTTNRVQLDTVAELGDYLVRVSRLVRTEHLTPPLSASREADRKTP